MSANVPSIFALQFPKTVELLLQQKGQMFPADCMRSGKHEGELAAPINQLASIEAQEVLTRFEPIARIDAVLSSRWCAPQNFDANQLIDTFDKLKLLVDPSSEYVVNATYALGRKKDDIFIASALGSALTGKQGTVATPFDTTNQQVANNFDASVAVGATAHKLMRARQKLIAAQVDMGNDQLWCAISSLQEENLLKEVPIASREFNSVPIYDGDGRLKRWLGINFVISERLLKTGNDRRCFMWAKSGMYMGNWIDGWRSDISQRKDIRGLPWQAYVYASFGSTRLEEAKVVEILCTET